MESYTINEVAAMTGFSTRTLRNYINMGILNGEKRTKYGNSLLMISLISSPTLMSPAA